MCSNECPWCRGPATATRTSADGDATEFQCDCGAAHTLKRSQPGATFAFFPPDIEACSSPDVKPLFPQANRR